MGVTAELPTWTGAGEAFTSLVVQIMRLNGLLLAAGDALGQPVGQTSAHWRVLAAVEDKPRSVAQIARAWGLARQSVQRVADVLVEDGLAVYQENPEHRRAQLLVLTPHGAEVLQAIQVAQRNWSNSLGEQIGETELRQVNAILAQVLQAVQKHSP